MMLTTVRLVSLLTLLQLGNVAPSPPPVRGTVEGTVLRANTREPVEDVRVVAISEATPDFFDPAKQPISPSATTDSQGKFSLKDVEPGAYRLTFTANGYVRQEYGQRVFPGKGSSVHLAGGQTIKDLTVELTPTGSVSGTIRDEEKRPLAGVPVQLMRDSFDQLGERRLRPNGTVVRTDDRGEFRIFFVTPGRYYLNAGTPSGPPGTGDRGPAANEVPDTFAYTYFPGVLALKDATPIEIQSGTAKTGMDFTVNRIRGVRVSGRVIDATTGQPPDKPEIKLAYRDPGVPWDYNLEDRGRGKVAYKDGQFEFRNVLPGLFGVVVAMDIPGQAPEAQRALQQRIGYVPIEVGGTDVEGIIVTISPGTAISGRVRVDGRNDIATAFPDPGAKPGIELQPRSNGAMPSTPGMPAPRYSPINSDGAFRIENVMPGEFHLQLSWMRSSFYIKEARLGSTDVLNTPFQFTGREPGNLEIVVSPNVATLDGAVTNNRMAPAAGAQVVLIPDKVRHRPELYKAASTDQNGRFHITNIAPGDYKLYAWEAIELYRWFDADYVKADERFAQTIHLGESAHQVADPRLIPAK